MERAQVRRNAVGTDNPRTGGTGSWRILARCRRGHSGTGQARVSDLPDLQRETTTTTLRSGCQRAPRRRNTAGMVLKRIAMSCHSVQLRTYQTSSRTRRS